MAQALRGVERPVGIAQHLASQQHDVGVSLANLLRLFGVGDHADRGGGDPRLAPDSGRERNLIAGAERNFAASDIAARGAIDESTPCLQPAREFDVCSTSQPPSVQSVAEMRTNSGQRRAGVPDRGGDFQREANSVLERTAVGVIAPVAQRE